MKYSGSGMFKHFIEWTEEDPARGRKVVLLSSVFVYLLIVLIVFIVGLSYPVAITTSIIQLFGTLTTLMAVVFGFYTTTSADKSIKLDDEAADILMNKLQKLDK